MTGERTKTRPVRVGVISLGCAKNLVDAEIMLGALLNDGIEITNDPARADALIVNTCAFIDAAQEESVDTILESAATRQAKHRRQALIVAGCLPQRFREELPRLLPEVDAFIGIDQVTQVADVVRRAMQRRAEKVRSQKSKVGSQISQITVRLAKTGRDQPVTADATAPGPRGTEQSGKTKVVPAPGRQCATRNASVPSSILQPPSSPILAVHDRPTYLPDYATPRFRLTPRHFAYVKIAEGCNHPCSFCTIPRIRGPHRSRPQADIVAEARVLLADGVKELNLISQDSTGYGRDLRPTRSRALAPPEGFTTATLSLAANVPTLCTLLRALNALPGEFWIRILYTHPAHWTDELIETIAACPKVARYVDIPLQHIQDNMLERMRRETSRASIEKLLRRIRAGVPGIVLRTTFMVGFPGETEACFQSLLQFITAMKFERLGVFTYSPEAGTRAGNMAGQVPDRIKRHRRELAMAAQREVATQVSAAFVGRTLRVLVEGQATAQQLRQARFWSREHGTLRQADPRPCLVARSEADAPDIDGRVFVRGRLPVGQFAWVRVTSHTDYDLMAEPQT